MSDEIMIAVHDVSKSYRLYRRPQDRLKQGLFWRLGRNYAREFWALRGINLEVRRGETVGIIGRNGSGKSTLLQIMAGVLQPSSGVVQVRGRVGALLELGSGFNPEYTGRENIFMNGAILGIPHHEMERRFDEIAGFADIGEFIDQPVKIYSSGMFVRLAFAVTTSVDADVLLIDEALAVGDVFFRQKCYRRLEALREKGVSIVLVSHAMLDVEQFCRRALLLDGGQALFEGPASEAVKRYYLIEQQAAAGQPPAPAAPAPAPATVAPLAGDDPLGWPAAGALLDISSASQVANGWARCTAVALCDSAGRPCRTFQQGETAVFFYEFELLQDIEVPIGGVEIHSDKGVIVHGKTTLEYGSVVPTWAARGSRLRFRQEIALEIAVGEYTFDVGLTTMSGYDFLNRGNCSHSALHARIVRLSVLPGVGQFAVMLRRRGTPVQLLHHGLANLPGACRVAVCVPNGALSG